MSCHPSPLEALQAAVRKLGSQQAMADVCSVSQPAVWKWLQSSKRLPAEYVLRVEAATGVSRHLLRPDIYPVDLPPAGRWSGEEPVLDAIDAVVPSNRNGNWDGRDRRANGGEDRFYAGAAR